MIDNPKIPDMAKGTKIPISIKEREFNELKAKYELKKQRRHEYRIAIVGAIAGAASGLATSFIFWLISN